MKKKLIAMLIACLCVVEAASVVVPLSEPVTVEAATKKASKKKKTPNLNKVYNAVKGAYGKDYTPNVKLSKDEVNARYGLKKEWYSGVVAELPMISVNADELVIVKAKDADSKKKIKNALKQYQKNLMENMHQYPANQLKVQASKVYVKGNYVCFFVLGSIDSKTEQKSDEKVIAAYKKQNEKAVNAIKKLYK
ncbi:MAG: DUF4358 domain-containing protein [Lachnobacterium sp.]|nr:DUF4358 domain-containing protein [Lachnobacterium sp.]